MIWRIDLASGRMQIHTDGRAVFEAPIPGQEEFFAARRGFDCIALDLTRQSVIFELSSGASAVVELHSPRSQPMPVVCYLDQNHWIDLARFRWDPDRLRAPVRDAAERLSLLAQSGEIILPFSAAHMTETAPTYGERRSRLGSTLLTLSRGWQMRNPVRVRHDELVAAIRGEDPRAMRVFTTDQHELFTRDLHRMPPPPGFPEALGDLFATMVAVIAHFSTLLIDERIVAADAEEVTSRWAQRYQDQANQLKSRSASDAEVRQSARARVLWDLRHESTQAAKTTGVDEADFLAWVQSGDHSAIVRMPYFGRFDEVVRLRLRNSHDRWHGHDLNDMEYLCCAAGYADVVVGENKAMDYIRRANRALGTQAFATASLAEAVTEIERLTTR